MRKPTKNIEKLPEIYIGLVARMGTNRPQIITTIKSEASKYGYKTVHIKVTDIVTKLPKYKAPKSEFLEDRIKYLIGFCNQVRNKSGDNAILTRLTLATIKKQRSKYQKATVAEEAAIGGPFRGIIYIVDQLKKPEEVEVFRNAYGEAFICLSCHSPYEARLSFLQNQITANHGASGDKNDWRDVADELISLDEGEEFSHGQDVRSAFPLADYIMDCLTSDKISKFTTRLFHLFFSNPSISPTFQEYANNLAAQAAYRSTDLSRQVGAAIFDNRRRVLGLGCNEVPKFGGGTYWEDNYPDGRDQNLGYDENTLRKQELLLDVITKMQKDGHLSAKLNKKSYDDLKKVLLAKKSLVKDAKVLDITEFGRALHAEMNVITDVARGQGSTQDTDLYVTTFPCHNCAKHIVGAGVKNVFYLEPYPKSQASELYPDSILVDPELPRAGFVSFQQFCGVTKRRYNYFSKSKLKDGAGKVINWSESKAICLVDLRPIDFSRTETKEVSLIAEVKQKKSILGDSFA